MTKKTKISFGLLAVAALFVGFFIGLSPAHAQTTCAPSDLACRVSALEARLAVLEGAQQTTAAQTEALQRAVPNLLDVSHSCATNCTAEAQTICVAHGFASGAPENWTRQRGGAVMLTQVSCRR